MSALYPNMRHILLFYQNKYKNLEFDRAFLFRNNGLIWSAPIYMCVSHRNSPVVKINTAINRIRRIKEYFLEWDISIWYCSLRL